MYNNGYKISKMLYIYNIQSYNNVIFRIQYAFVKLIFIHFQALS